MTAALGNTAPGTPFATGVDAFVYPQFIGYALRTPTTNDIYNPGTRWQDNSVNPPVIYETSGAGRWFLTGTSLAFTSLTVNGPTSLNDDTTVTGDLTVSDNITTTAGNLVASGVGKGLVLNPTLAVAGASPRVANGRVFSAVFSGVSIAAAASQSFTITNSAIAGASTLLLLSMSGATAGAALSIVSVVNSAGQSIITVTNGTGAATEVANITFTGLVLN